MSGPTGTSSLRVGALVDELGRVTQSLTKRQAFAQP